MFSQRRTEKSRQKKFTISRKNKTWSRPHKKQLLLYSKYFLMTLDIFSGRPYLSKVTGHVTTITIMAFLASTWTSP